jgi:hypothetical protein
MKWMMWSVALMIAVVLPVAVRAEFGTKGKGDKMDKKTMKDSTYTGCIEAGSTAGTFMLTRVAADDMGKKALNKKGAMKKDTMVPTIMPLTSASVDLSEHLGHTVSVTGSVTHGKDATAQDVSAFNVRWLETVATSCS